MMSRQQQELALLAYSKKTDTTNSTVHYYLHIQCKDEGQLQVIKTLLSDVHLPFTWQNLVITIFPDDGLGGMKGAPYRLELSLASKQFLWIFLEKAGDLMQLPKRTHSKSTTLHIPLEKLHRLPFIEEKEVSSAIMQLSTQVTLTLFLLKQYFPKELQQLLINYLGQLVLGRLYDKCAHMDYIQHTRIEDVGFLYRSLCAATDKFARNLWEHDALLKPEEASHLRYIHGALLEKQTRKMQRHFLPLFPQNSTEYLALRYHHRIRRLDANRSKYSTEKRYFVYAEICILYLLAIMGKGEHLTERIKYYIYKIRRLFDDGIFRPQLAYSFLESFKLYDIHGERSEYSLIYFVNQKLAILVMPPWLFTNRIFENPRGVTVKQYWNKVVTIKQKGEHSGGIVIGEDDAIQISCGSEQEKKRLCSAYQLDNFPLGLSDKSSAHIVFFKPAACPGLVILRKIMACVKRECLFSGNVNKIIRPYARNLMGILQSSHENYSTDFKLVVICAFLNDEINIFRCPVFIRHVIIDALSAEEKCFLKKHAQLYGQDNQLDYIALGESILEELFCNPIAFSMLSEENFPGSRGNARSINLSGC